ncbi:MAG: ATP-binding protein [Chloroflexota bacterium]
MFVNRLAELALLEKHYQSGRAELFVLYGRRRVGKTELLAHFCAGKPHVFFVADQAPEKTLRAGLSMAVNDVLFGPGQVNAIYNSWDDLFAALAQQSQSQRLVVALDEFPYLIAAYPPFASILQRHWDRSLKNSQIMLILNGSYIGMMEETVLGYQAPLYGRRTAQYLLEPLEFFDAQSFFGEFTPEDRLRAYAIYGGTPAYLQTVNPENSLETNIIDGILARGSFLYDEVRFVLQQELREPRNYFAVLQAIASGHTRQNEIKQAAGLENLAPYLETLQQLHLIERIVPVTENQPHKSRRGLYRLKDNYLRFWFKFVLPNRSQLERGAKEMVYETRILPELDHFSALAFEQVCAQYFWRQALNAGLPFQPRQVGRWWQANQEVDLVLLGEKQVLLAECKWSNRPVGEDILVSLEGKSKLVLREAGLKQASFALCSRSGFTDQVRALAKERNDIYLYEWESMIRG